jgi:quercetin dioxygenase-like cupin family protein
VLATEQRRDAIAVEVLETAPATDGRWGALSNSHQEVQRIPSSSRRYAVLAMAAGLLVTAVAMLSLVARSGAPSGAAGTGTRPSVPVSSSGVALGSRGDVQAQMATYAPGQSSDWHSHTGMHAVVVVSGTLTIIDGGCQRRIFGPGESYVGGRDVHLALNETAAPVEMAVTYLFPAGASHTGLHLPAAVPGDCAVR